MRGSTGAVRVAPRRIARSSRVTGTCLCTNCLQLSFTSRCTTCVCAPGRYSRPSPVRQNARDKDAGEEPGNSSRRRDFYSSRETPRARFETHVESRAIPLEMRFEVAFRTEFANRRELPISIMISSSDRRQNSQWQKVSETVTILLSLFFREDEQSSSLNRGSITSIETR